MQFFKDKIQRVDRLKNVTVKYPPFIISENSKLKLYWDVVMILWILYIAFELPWEFAFPEDSPPVVNYFILIFFLLDILISFRTTYFDDEQAEIVHWRLIMMNYVKSANFYVDMVSFFPFDLIESVNNKSVQVMFKVLKMIRLLRLGKLLKHLQSDKLKAATYVIRYVFGLLLIWHWLTLIWLAVAYRS